MAFFKRFLFWQKNEDYVPASQELAPGLILRSKEELAAKDQWAQSDHCAEIKAWIKAQYRLFLLQTDTVSAQIDFLDTPSSKGFVLHLSQFDQNEAQWVYLLDHLKDQVLKQQYRVALSDVRKLNKGPWQEHIQRHYLKPRTSQNEEGLIRQRFGNVTIELAQRNARWFQLRFQATGYHDRLYQEAWDFEYMMEALSG